MSNPRRAGKSALLLYMGLAGMLVWTASPAAEAYQKFFGHYEGHASYTDRGETLERDLGVDIKPAKHGFKVGWKTTSITAGKKSDEKSYSIDFVPSERPNIYGSAMKVNVFGGREPLDPMKGDPYVWARIDGDTLTIYAMLVTNTGGYEMQVYNRTLTGAGLELKFSRIRNGEKLKEIDALLLRK